MSDASDRLFELFVEASELAPAEREVFLERLSGADSAHADELRALLASDTRAGRLPREAKALSVSVRDPALDELRSLSPPAARYALPAEIGRGGMGRVDRAWDAALHREVARKTLLTPGGAPMSGRAERFLREARITAALDHSGIPPVHDFGVDDQGRLYFTMQRVEGRTLHEVFALVAAGEAGWNINRALGVLVRVCDTVAFAHARGVLHRDLKPTNVLVGEFGEVWVVDWGIARRAGAPDERERATEDPQSADLTRAGDVSGTPRYMSPEQAEGRTAEVDERSDVYAAGLLVYECVSGCPPFDHLALVGSSESPTHERLLRERIACGHRLRYEARPGISGELLSICRRATSPERADRYSSMAALAADLRAFLEHRPVLAHDSSMWSRVRKWTRRNPLAAGLTGALALGLVAFGAWAWRAAVTERGLRRTAERETARARGVLAAQLCTAPGREVEALALAIQAVGEPMLVGEAAPSEALGSLLTSLERAQVRMPLRSGQPSDEVTAAAMSSDGTLAATGNIHGVVRLFDTAQRRELASTRIELATPPVRSPEHGSAGRTKVDALEFSSNADVLAVLTVEGTTLLAVPELRALAQLDSWGRLSPDGSLLISLDETSLRTHVVAELAASAHAPPSAERGLPAAEPRGVFVDATGRHIAVRRSKREVRVFSLPDLEPVGELLLADNLLGTVAVHALAFSPLGDHLAIGTQQRLALLSLDLSQPPERVWSFEHDERLRDFAFAPDGTKIVACCASSTLRVLDLANGSVVDFDSGLEGTNRVSFTPDGEHLLVADSNTVRALNVRTDEQTDFARVSGFVQSTRGGPNGPFVAASRLGEAHLCWLAPSRSNDLWELKEWRASPSLLRRARREADSDWLTQVAHLSYKDEDLIGDLVRSPDDKVLLALLGSTGLLGPTLEPPPGTPRPPFASDRRLVLYDVERRIELSRAKEEELVHEMIESFEFSPAGERVVVQTRKEALVLSLPSLAVERRIPGIDILRTACSRDGRRLALQTYTSLRIEALIPHDDAAAVTIERSGGRLVATPDGHFLVSSFGGGLSLRSADDGLELAQYSAGDWHDIAFSNDGRRFAISVGGEVSLYDRGQRDPLAVFQHAGVDVAEFSADGRALISWAGNVDARRWELDPRVLLGRALVLLQHEPACAGWAARYASLTQGD